MASALPLWRILLSLCAIVHCLSALYVNHKTGIITNMEITDYSKVAVKDPNSVVIDGDILIDVSRNAVPTDAQRWPNGVVPYVISSQFQAADQQKILNAMKEIENSVNNPGQQPCITFRNKVATDQHALNIIPAADECTAFVGVQDSTLQEVNFGSDCLVSNGIILHELLHALGFEHEQSRPDRDSFVDIDYNNIQSSQRWVFEKLLNTRTLNFYYDYESIMHYDPYSFPIDYRKTTIVPKGNPAIHGPMGQRWRLSNVDVLRIQRLYRCTEDNSHIQLRPLLASCSFETDFCNFQNDLRATGNWALRQGPSVTNGPLADRSTGKGNYAVAEGLNNAGKTFRLVSPQLTDAHICLELYMYNYQTPGSFSIKTRRMGSTYLRSVLSYPGQTAQMWYYVKLNINVPSYEIPYQLVLVADPNGNDIAVDDILIFKGVC